MGEIAAVNARLQSLQAQEVVSLPDLLQALYASRFRGTLVLHFDHGEPKKVEFPPAQMKLVRG